MRRPSSAGPKTRSSATSSSWKRWWRIWKSAKRFLFFSVNHLRFNLYHPAHYVSAHLSVSSSVGCHAQKRNWVHIILGKNLLYNSVYAIKKSSVCICSTHLEFGWVHIYFLHALLPIYCRPVVSFYRFYTSQIYFSFSSALLFVGCWFLIFRWSFDGNSRHIAFGSQPDSVTTVASNTRGATTQADGCIKQDVFRYFFSACNVAFIL